MTKNVWLTIVAICLFAAACAGPITTRPQGNTAAINREAQLQRELVYKNFIRDQDRVFNVGFPIRAANASFCGKRVEPAIGLTAWNLSTTGSQFRQAAQSLYNLQERLAVQFVADSSPAAKAGIKSGDFVISVNGQTVPTGARALETAARVFNQGGYNPTRIVIERNGRQMTKTVRPVRTCAYPVRLDYSSNDINAYANGELIVLSKGMLRFVENDGELAMVLAHELAHNTHDHIFKRQQNAAVGSIGGLIADSLLAAAGVSTGGRLSNLGGQMGAMRHSVAFEQEADYVGMYYMERAGYSSQGVANLWRRMAAENPRGIYTRTTHPTSPERFVAIEKTRAEILSKKKRGLSLAPNLAKE